MKFCYSIPLFFSLLLTIGCAHQISVSPSLLDAFVSLSEIDASIEQDIRYFTSNNFTGRPITGYTKPKCILTSAAANALSQAQQQANRMGYSLKVYDCYRPQRAVSDFVVWAKNEQDTRMQHRFYPAVPKRLLFTEGYIAEKSGHSRGSTMDLTLVPRHSRQPEVINASGPYDCRAEISGRYPDNSIDMGTGYDCFDTLAHTNNQQINIRARHNRLLLKTMMQRAGFVNYEKEWWHYTLREEPFPDTYFDFVIQ